VKRRYVDGNLELLCIPNKAATKIQSARDEFFKLVNDLQHPGQSKKSDQQNKSLKSFNAEYFAAIPVIGIQHQLNEVRQKAIDRYLLQIPSVYLTRAGQPPDFA